MRKGDRHRGLARICKRPSRRRRQLPPGNRRKRNIPSVSQPQRELHDEIQRCSADTALVARRGVCTTAFLIIDCPPLGPLEDRKTWQRICEAALFSHSAKQRTVPWIGAVFPSATRAVSKVAWTETEGKDQEHQASYDETCDDKMTYEKTQN